MPGHVYRPGSAWRSMNAPVTAASPMTVTTAG
jgi:hypothetical protein